MAQQQSGSLGIRLEGSDETFWAQPRPEDQERIKELLRGGSATVSLVGDAQDLEGHAQSAEVTLDVEGHALTLRLPSPADAAELRRRLAVGAVAATIVVAGAAAALQGASNASSVQAPAGPAPMVQPRFADEASDIGIVDQSAQQAAEDFNRSGAGANDDDRTMPRPGPKPELR